MRRIISQGRKKKRDGRELYLPLDLSLKQHNYIHLIVI
jgi:hypothetical protein